MKEASLTIWVLPTTKKTFDPIEIKLLIGKLVSVRIAQIVLGLLYEMVISNRKNCIMNGSEATILLMTVPSAAEVLNRN